MAIEVTENWRGRSATRGRQRAAQRAFVVTGVTDEHEALTATDASSGLTIPSYGDAHPNDANGVVKVSNVTAAEEGFGYWTVTVTYTQPEGRARHRPVSDDPLDEPATVFWDIGTRQDYAERDINGNPIVNSARQGFDPPVTVDVPQFFLVVQRNEPFFDVGLAKDMLLAVNSDTLTVEGVQVADPGFARCVSMRPIAPYQLSAEYVAVEYRFELADRIEGAPAGTNPFYARIMDQGTRGWAGGSEYELFDANGDPIHSPVRLGGDGQPMSSSIKLGAYAAAGAGLAAPAGATVENGGDDDATFLWYQLYKSREFARFGL